MNQLVEGSPVYIKGSGAKPYELKNVGGVYSCSCPAWRNQGAAIDRRTCKHLKAHLGEAAEAARTGSPAPTPSPTVQALGIAKAISSSAQTILDRAASQGRKLRPDEKAKLNGPPVLLALQDTAAWKDVDPTGWWMSEKLDGVRAYWNGNEFITRQGNVYRAPDWFIKGLPSHPLDGELWMGRGEFQRTISVVKRHDATNDWMKVKYVVFDLPHLVNVPFEERMRQLEELVVKSSCAYLQLHPQTKCCSKQHVIDELECITNKKGEGLMLREPKSLYEIGRSSTLLKVKPFKDMEGTVMAHKPGKGRHKGVLGAVVVRIASGKEFDLGSGFTDAERRNPPKIGDTITFSYTELTNDGIPKCTGFIAVRDYE